MKSFREEKHPVGKSFSGRVRRKRMKMTVKTTFAAAVFAITAGAATAALAATTPNVPPCAQQMGDVYAELAQEMNLTGNAKAAFDKYVAARQKIAADHWAWHEKNDKRPATREEAMKLRADHMKVRADMLEDITNARAALDKSLTPEQQDILDSYEPGYGMGPGYGPGYGPGNGYGPGPRHHFRGHRGDWGYGPGCGWARGDRWGWHGPRHGYGAYGWGPGCRW